MTRCAVDVRQVVDVPHERHSDVHDADVLFDPGAEPYFSPSNRHSGVSQLWPRQPGEPPESALPVVISWTTIVLGLSALAPESR
jgi:hypothetical protein